MKISQKTSLNNISHTKSSFKRDLPFHLMMLPGIILLAVFAYLPMLGLVMCFQNFDPTAGFLNSKWVGFDNFIYLFTMQDFSRVMWNTVSIAVMKIVTQLSASLIFALLLNEVRNKVSKKTIQTVVFFPYFISWVLLSGIIIDFLSPTYGIVNKLITLFGGKPIFFLADNNWFPSVLIVTNTWKEFGWGAIVYLAAICGIDSALYEAAMMDGAGKLKQVIHITLPCILPMVILTCLLNLGNILNAGFDQIFNLYSPVVYESGDVIDTLVYRLGIVSAQYSLGSAMGIFKSLVSLILILISYKLADKFAGYRVI